MITQQQVGISSRTIVASLALATALVLGGVTGYAVRGMAQPYDPAPGRPAIQSADPSTSDTNGSVTPQRCSSSLGPEDYETCKIQFGESGRGGSIPSLPTDFFQ